MRVGNNILLYHDLLDCGMRKLTVGFAIALLIQSLDCYKTRRDREVAPTGWVERSETQLQTIRPQIPVTP